jgi:putative FmdB family regulatory protein
MTYEYLCTACGHQWEADQSITAPALKDCPKCNKAKAQRQVSGGTGFVLKGGGWYADLYSSSKSSKSKEASGDAAEKADTPKSDSAKTDAPKVDAPKSSESSKGDKPSSGSKATKTSADP